MGGALARLPLHHLVQGAPGANASHPQHRFLDIEDARQTPQTRTLEDTNHRVPNSVVQMPPADDAAGGDFTSVK